MRTMGDFRSQGRKNVQMKLKSWLKFVQGEAMFLFKFYYAYVLMENENERWKTVGFDPMANIL